jgi:hypothetical protein
MIKRLLLSAAFATLAANGASTPRNTAARIDAKLSPEQKILQVLNRLTFGARPAAIEAVRKLGLEKSIELQLHPERIAENAALEARLNRRDHPWRAKFSASISRSSPTSAGPFKRIAGRIAIPQGL